jgi:hypothetical protein
MNDKEKIDKLLTAISLLVTYFGMDEDEWSKPVFDNVRRILAEVRNG